MAPSDATQHLPTERSRRRDLTFSRLDIVVVVWGTGFLDLFERSALRNLLALVEEIPSDVRSKARIVLKTTPADSERLGAMPGLQSLEDRIAVKIDTSVDTKAMVDRFGGYGPMQAAQWQAVIDASRDNAAVILSMPDVVFSAGSFRAIVGRAAAGVRAIVAASLRVQAEAVLAQWNSVSVAAPLSIDRENLKSIIIDHWHGLNDIFCWNGPRTVDVMPFFFYRSGGCGGLVLHHLQGQVFFAFPHAPIESICGTINQCLTLYCCRDDSEFCIADVDEILTADLAPRARVETLPIMRWRLLRLFQWIVTVDLLPDVQIRGALRGRYFRRATDIPSLTTCIANRVRAARIGLVIQSAASVRPLYRRLASSAAQT